jgi:hypothetical protein
VGRGRGAARGGRRYAQAVVTVRSGFVPPDRRRRLSHESVAT